VDIKKRKKLKKKYQGFALEYRKYVGYHLYRSTDRNAPFSEWQRLSEKPLTESFTDNYDKDENQRYYYKMTDVDVRGIESKPYEPKMVGIRNGKEVEMTPENSIFGMNFYWSLDPDLPLEQWTLMNEKPVEEPHSILDCPVKVPYYMYGIYVNDLGNEFGKRSDPQRIVPKA
jgi:hypothetical protein